MLRWLLQRQEILFITPFLGLILIGSALLATPLAQVDRPVDWIDAAFTATSAVCVTGLITRDTAVDFSRFGQVVILVLIQVGGLGVMTLAAVAFHVFRLHLPFGSHAAVRDALLHPDQRGRLRNSVARIIGLALVIELIGALVLWLGLSLGRHGGWFEAMFTSVSAFCNAGFSVYSDSAISLRSSWLCMGTLMALIVLGGLGYTVLMEIGTRFARILRGTRGAPVNWSLNSRIVLGGSATLIVAGALGMLFTGLSPEVTGGGERVANAVFQSVTARTAGFNTIDLALVPLPTLMILMPLMLIGGAPGSCAGGVKVTTIVVWLARVRARLAGRSDVTLGEREIPPEVVRRAALVLAIAALWNGAGVFLLVMTQNLGDRFGLEDVLFEQISAFGTVGLSTGMTPELTPLGKLWIMASMFVGRLGPLTIALAVVRREARPKVRYPEERVMIG